MAVQQDWAILTGITGLTADSRAVKLGYLFAAFQGDKIDGRSFIAQALDAGAAVILTDTVPTGLATTVACPAAAGAEPTPPVGGVGGGLLWSATRLGRAGHRNQRQNVDRGVCPANLVCL